MKGGPAELQQCCPLHQPAAGLECDAACSAGFSALLADFCSCITCCGAPCCSHFGGVYYDLDVECFRSGEDLLAGADVVLQVSLYAICMLGSSLACVLAALH